MRQKLTIVFLFFLLSYSSMAQKFSSPVKPSLIGFHFGFVDYNTPNQLDTSSIHDVIHDGDIFKPRNQAPAFTISYWKGLNKYIDLSGKFNGIFYDYALNNTGQQYTNEFGAELEAALNFHPISDAHLFTPFLTAGINGGYYTNRFGGNVPLGIGFQFNIRSQVYFLLQSQYRVSLSKDVFPNNLYHSIGVGINIEKEKPAPPPVVVPIVEVKDRDNDGIVDSLDACPDEAGTAALQGCPDRDGDGIADKDDKCPDVAGIAKYQGCPIPDTDKDGINDEEDKCPDVAGIAKYQGCPIPDTDGDGVNDEDDRCPNEVGPKENAGCPVIGIKSYEIVFKTGSAVLVPNGKKVLDIVVTYLNDHPKVNVSVSGYTDNTGSDKINQPLSEKRAESAKAYLMSKGISESRLTTAGYGSANPIADNKTAKGRAMNRRIEIRVQ